MIIGPCFGTFRGKQSQRPPGFWPSPSVSRTTWRDTPWTSAYTTTGLAACSTERGRCTERPVLAAGSLALAISIKVWPLFFVPYLAVRRDWKVVGYALSLAVLLAILPSFYFGFAGNLDLIGQWFAQESRTQLGESEIWFPNQSLRGVLMRYLTAIDYTQLPDSNYAQIHIVALDPAPVRLTWMILAGAAYAGFLLLANRRRNS